MAAKVVQTLDFPDRQGEYIVNTLDPLLEEMCSDVLRKMPEDPTAFLISWLRKRQEPASAIMKNKATEKEITKMRQEPAATRVSPQPRPSPEKSPRSSPKPSKETQQNLTGESKLSSGRSAAKLDRTSQRARSKEDAADSMSSPVEFQLGRRSSKDLAADKADLAKKSESEDDATDEEEEDELMEEPPPEDRGLQRKPRKSVSAEVYGQWNARKAFDPPAYPKTNDVKERLRAILHTSIVFMALDNRDMDIVLLALEEITFEPGEEIIEEGDDGEHLFIVEEGNPVCSKMIDGREQILKRCVPGDIFGELALLYNCPRAATVVAQDACRCWQLDRETFSHIVKEGASKRTRQYDNFLSKVGLLSSLSTEERQTVLESLKIETFTKGNYIVKQGDIGDSFYILEDGNLHAIKGVQKVKDYKPGDYFGELAILKSQPRAANVVVASQTAKVLSLDRASFHRLLGPLEDLLARTAAENYS